MTDKDQQELDSLRKQLQCLQVQAADRDHQFVSLQVHTAKQDQRLSRLLNLLGLVPDDLNAPGVLTTTATLLLRLSRPEN